MRPVKIIVNHFLNKVIISIGVSVLLITLLFMCFKIDTPIIRAFSIVVFLGSVYTFKKNYQDMSSGLIIGLVGSLIILLVFKVVETFTDIHEFDFLCFYFFGKLGVSGGDFYNPKYSMEVFNSLNLKNYSDSTFISEIVNVGFWYPPPSMFLFLPLGFLDVKTALIIWKVFIILSLVFSLFFVVKFFVLKRQHFNITLILASLFLILNTTNSTLFYLQTNFVLLLLMVFILNNINNWKSGILLTVAIIIKPFALIWVIYFIITKKYNVLFGMVITGILTLVLTIIVFGYDQFFAYLNSPPTLRLPEFVYMERTNQSLSSILLRLQIDFNSIHIQTLKLLTICISILLTIFNIVFSLKLEKFDPKIAFLTFLPLSLIIYPASQAYYTILLLPIYFYFVQKVKSTNLLVSILFLFIIGVYLSPFLTNLLTLFAIFASLKFRFIDITMISNNSKIGNLSL